MSSLLDSLFAHSPFAAVVVGPDSEIVRYNRHFQELTGLTEKSLRGRPVLEMIDQCRDGSGQTARRAGRPSARPPLFRTTNANGDTLFLRIHEFPFDHEGGRWALILFHDETEETRLRDEIQHMSRLASVGKLLSFVVHEIGNFTAVIKGCAELIGARKGVDSSTKEEARRIQSEGDRVSEIIRNFLGFARKDGNEIELLSGEELLAQVAEIKKYSLKRKKVAFSIAVHKGLQQQISGNRTLLMQVLLNLIDNAEEAVKDCQKREIQLVLGTQGDKVAIEVSDSGPGIPESLRHKIFDAFFTTKSDNTGTGLGLSICRRIVQNHDGDLILKRSSPGEGTVFQILLPSATARTAAKSAEEEKA